MDMEEETEREPDKSVVRCFINMFLLFGHKLDFSTKKTKETCDTFTFQLQLKVSSFFRRNSHARNEHRCATERLDSPTYFSRTF